METREKEVFMLKNDWLKSQKNHIRRILFVLFAMAGFHVNGQEQTLIGHQDFPGYYNPSLISGGTHAQISIIHRTQWEGFGPVSNTLYFKYPFRNNDRLLEFKSVGTFIQYEDLSFFTRTSVQVFSSNVLTKFNGNTLSMGVNFGLSTIGLKLDEFDLEELIDPELPNLDRRVTITNRLGFSLNNPLFEIGVSGASRHFNQFSDINSTLSFNVPVKNPHFGLRPLLVFRASEMLDSQMEIQIRTIYKKKLTFTAGYRQHFGPLFQLGLTFNKKVKGSYGSELPSGKNSALGLTHEFFASLTFETAEGRHHRADSVFKVHRDSVNRARIDSIRIVRSKEFEAEEESKPDDIVKDEPVSEDPDLDTKSVEEKPDGIISFDELSDQPGINTHVILDHIGFEQGLYLLKPYAFDELDRLIAYIKHHKHLHVEIQGHTDDSGSSEHNHQLSKRRALTVYNYLISRGIDDVRLNVVGYGEDLPLFPNDTDEHRRLNRRIEVVFIEID